MVLLALLEALVLREVQVVLEALAHMYPKGQTVQTVLLHLTVQTITMWLQPPLMLHIQEHITTTTIRHDILTNMVTRLLLTKIIKVITMKAHIGIMVVTIITLIMMDHMVVFTTGMVITGTHGDLIITA
jgi:hypothetical protein